MKNLKTYIKGIVLAGALCFGSVMAFAEPNESISHSVTHNQPQVRVLHSQIEITVSGEDDCNVTIYALTGQVVKSFNATPGVNTVDLPKGYYIVKCDRVSCRVVVK